MNSSLSSIAHTERGGLASCQWDAKGARCATCFAEDAPEHVHFEGKADFTHLSVCGDQGHPTTQACQSATSSTSVTSNSKVEVVSRQRKPQPEQFVADPFDSVGAEIGDGWNRSVEHDTGGEFENEQGK